MAVIPCLEQQRLIHVVQDHLMRISELTRATSDAVADGNEHLAQELDRACEGEIGAKERAFGALKQHRAEHGC